MPVPFASEVRSSASSGTRCTRRNVTVASPAIRSELSFTANPFLERNFGRNSVEGIAFTYGWQAKYEVGDGFAVGIEAYGRIEHLGDPPPWSEQEHIIGPVVYAEIPLGRDFKITPDIGVLFGLTRATPDVALKLNVGIPLYQ